MAIYKERKRERVKKDREVREGEREGGGRKRDRGQREAKMSDERGKGRKREGERMGETERELSVINNHFPLRLSSLEDNEGQDSGRFQSLSLSHSFRNPLRNVWVFSAAHCLPMKRSSRCFPITPPHPTPAFVS